MGELIALGFESDLGPSMGLQLPNGTTILVCAYDEHGEPDIVTDLDAPAFAQHFDDPMDHSTLIRQEEKPTLRELLGVLGEWIAETK